MYSRQELEDMGTVYRDWSNNVSPSTQQALDDLASKFRGLQYEMDVISLDGVITQTEVDQLISRVNDMCSDIITAIENHNDPAYQALYELFAQDGAIDAAEQVLLDAVTGGMEAQIEEVQKGKDRIEEIYQNAADNNKDISEDEQREITEIQARWQEISLENLTVSQAEREAALNEFYQRCNTESLEGLSEIVKTEMSSHDESKQALINKYEEQIATAKEQLPKLEGVAREEAEARIAQYEEMYRIELENEETLYSDKMALLNEKYPELINEIFGGQGWDFLKEISFERVGKGNALPYFSDRKSVV